MQKVYFERIRFVAEDKLMRVFDDAGLEAVKAWIGTTIPADERAYDCLKRDRPANATICLEWMNRGRFSLSLDAGCSSTNDQMQCYRVLWQSLSPDTHPTDCFEMNSHLWYGAGAVLGRHYDFAGESCYCCPRVVPLHFVENIILYIMPPMPLIQAGR